MHPHNIHKEGYDFDHLVKVLPALSAWVNHQKGRRHTIDFSNPIAVKTLNKALLLAYYNIKFWDIPTGYLCPPVPSRADYIHHLQEWIMNKRHHGQITAMDIGTGANLIYPIIAVSTYDWKVIATETDTTALKAAKAMVAYNESLGSMITIRPQDNPMHLFKGVVKITDRITCTLCNPPFYKNEFDAEASNKRTNNNLTQKSVLHRNFGGQNHELWTIGGELGFLSRMVIESQQFSEQIKYFSSLVADKFTLKRLVPKLREVGAKSDVVEMAHGQKISRILLWWYD